MNEDFKKKLMKDNKVFLKKKKKRTQYGRERYKDLTKDGKEKLAQYTTRINLQLNFISCFENGKFPTQWKKPNALPVHKKGDKKLKNCHLCLLLLEKYLKKCYIITYMNSLQKIIQYY